MATLKKFSSSSSADIDLQDKFNVKNSKQQNFSYLASNYDNLVSHDDVKNIFLSRKETFAMEAELNMGNHQIVNVKDSTVSDHGANKKYVDAETAKLTTSTNTKFATAQSQRNLKADKSSVDTTFLKLFGGTMTSDIDTGGNKITNLSSPTATSEPATKNYADTTFLKLSGGSMTGDIDTGGNKITNLLLQPPPQSQPPNNMSIKVIFPRVEFRRMNFFYLMKDVNESSSESNITVLGIKTFPQTPHTINKNAYKFTMKKLAQNKYASRLGFNFYKLPAGAYTFVVEFFPPTQTNVSVNCLSTSINVNHQMMKNFQTYCKNLVQLHKWKISSPEYLMVDIKCDGTSSSPANGTGWMVVYGIERTHTDVPSSVFDRPFLIYRGDMFMEIEIDMNYQAFLLYKGWNMDELIIKAHHKMICERYGVDHDRISFP